MSDELDGISIEVTNTLDDVDWRSSELIPLPPRREVLVNGLPWTHEASDPVADILGAIAKIRDTYDVQPSRLVLSPSQYAFVRFEMLRHRWAEKYNWERHLFPRWTALAVRWRRRRQQVRNWRRKRRWAREGDNW